MQKIDAHHHFWDLDLKKNHWLLNETSNDFLGDYSDICKSYLQDEYHHDCKHQHIVKSVHVQAGWDNKDPIGETKWLQHLADKHEFPHAIVAYADLSADNVEPLLEKHADFANMRGIRQILNWHKDKKRRCTDKDYLNLDAWRKNFALLQKYALSFDLQIYPEQVDSAYKLIKENSGVNVVIDHALLPYDQDPEFLKYWQKQLAKMAELPNVYIKLSGIGMYKHHWEETTLIDLFRPVVDIFSPERCMFGSNFPVDRLFSSIDDLYAAFTHFAQNYSDEERKQLFYDSASYFYAI